jgi:hypothetical protein
VRPPTGAANEMGDAPIEKVTALHARTLRCLPSTSDPTRAQALTTFAANLEKAFYGFEPDFFQQNILRIADDVVSSFKGSIELWPTLVEIFYFQKNTKGLPTPASAMTACSWRPDTWKNAPQQSLRRVYLLTSRQPRPSRSLAPLDQDARRRRRGCP